MFKKMSPWQKYIMDNLSEIVKYMPLYQCHCCQYKRIKPFDDNVHINICSKCYYDKIRTVEQVARYIMKEVYFTHSVAGNGPDAFYEYCRLTTVKIVNINEFLLYKAIKSYPDDYAMILDILDMGVNLAYPEPYIHDYGVETFLEMVRFDKRLIEAFIKYGADVNQRVAGHTIMSYTLRDIFANKYINYYQAKDRINYLLSHGADLYNETFAFVKMADFDVNYMTKVSIINWLIRKHSESMRNPCILKKIVDRKHDCGMLGCMHDNRYVVV